MNPVARLTMVIGAACAIQIAHAQTPAPDNTKQNRLDSMNISDSADKQKNDKTDLMLSQQIRTSLMADHSLSTYAHNVKIVAVNGNVTLNGVVRSQHEKEAVEAKAQAVVTSGSLVSNLKIAEPSH